MKKALSSIFILPLVLMLCAPSFAAVGIYEDNVPSFTATDINFKGSGDSITTDGSKLNINLMLAGPRDDAATSMITTDTAVPTGYAFVRKKLSSSTDVAMTLADGIPGQILTLYISEVDASGTAILTPTTKTGFSTLTFDAVGDQVTLLFVNTSVGWIIMSSTSVSVGLPNN